MPCENLGILFPLHIDFLFPSFFILHHLEFASPHPPRCSVASHLTLRSPFRTFALSLQRFGHPFTWLLSRRINDDPVQLQNPRTKKEDKEVPRSSSKKRNRRTSSSHSSSPRHSPSQTSGQTTENPFLQYHEDSKTEVSFVIPGTNGVKPHFPHRASTSSKRVSTSSSKHQGSLAELMRVGAELAASPSFPSIHSVLSVPLDDIALLSTPSLASSHSSETSSVASSTRSKEYTHHQREVARHRPPSDSSAEQESLATEHLHPRSNVPSLTNTAIDLRSKHIHFNSPPHHFIFSSSFTPRVPRHRPSHPNLRLAGTSVVKARRQSERQAAHHGRSFSLPEVNKSRAEKISDLKLKQVDLKGQWAAQTDWAAWEAKQQAKMKALREEYSV
ncbi:hypothetical protein P7C70_g1998, partial [Phenoliferia sp. Uapishka_3]